MKVVKETPTTVGPIGLHNKWGRYNKDLAYNGTTTFVQFVPSDAATIHACMASQNIMDAVYNRNKAFWVADPSRFELGSSNGKVKMLYTFSEAAAKSLMEDYLICGSGDYANDNEED